MDKNLLEIKSFCVKITKEEFDKLCKVSDKSISLVCEYGAVIFDESKYVIEEDRGNYWFASIDMLERGRDGVFVQLKHDVNEFVDVDKIPCFKEVFKLKKM